MSNAVLSISSPVAGVRPRGRLADFCASQPIGATCLALIIAMLATSLLADYIAPYDGLAVDYDAILAGPSLAHLAGTDVFGRDVFSRLIYGARTALIIGIASSFIGCTIGALIGATSAYFGGRVDAIIQRALEILLAFPLVVLALVMVAVLGRNIIYGIDVSLIFAIAIPIIPQVSRVIRAAALSVSVMPYIDAARSAGYLHSRIIFMHMMPNLVSPYLIMLSIYVAQAILLESTLSFLGLGVAEPTAAWGLMLAGNAQDYFIEAPWLIIFPGVAISVAVIAFNLFGDALRDWLDPKLRR